MDHYQQELTTFDQDIQALLLTGAHLSDTPEFILKETELHNHLEKLNREIITPKKKKLFRDRKAFISKKAYRWFNPSNHKGDRFPQRTVSSNVQNGGGLLLMMNLCLCLYLPIFLLCDPIN